MKRDRQLFEAQFIDNFIQCPFVFLQPKINKIQQFHNSQVKQQDQISISKYNQEQEKLQMVYKKKHQKYQLEIQPNKNILMNIQNYRNLKLYQLIDQHQLIFNNIFRILIEIKIVLDQQIPDETSKTIKDSQSPTTSEIQKVFQKKSTKTSAAKGVTTDLKDVIDIKIEKKYYQFLKKINLEQKNQKHYNIRIIIIICYSQQLNSKQQIISKVNLNIPRRSSNVDEFSNLLVSQKFGNLTHQLDQEQNKWFIKQLSQNSENSEMQESLIIIENKGKKIQIGGDKRKKKRKTTLQLEQQSQRKYYQNQQPNLSQSVLQKQQLMIILDQKLKMIKYWRFQKINLSKSYDMGYLD
ncbi:unnamed protein product [Paramecium primaurelia]|uniref:Uncharacterized protein n=1 Tax=Paramecium primaurelia TaxID=5886 RepID=A0A8S1NZU6_PARPR|nr:unnamed protein product [Paramecium primaurelia]